MSSKCVDTSKGLRTMPGCGENSVSIDHYYSSHERGSKGFCMPASWAGPPETYSDSLLGPREPLKTQPGAPVNGPITTRSTRGVVTLLRNLLRVDAFSEDAAREPFPVPLEGLASR